MQLIDGKWYVSLSHWGMHPLDTSFMKWEADSNDFTEVPFEIDMQRATNILQRMKALKSGTNAID